MGKDKSLGVNKAATTGGGSGKRRAGAYYKSLGVNKAAAGGGGKGKGTGGWNGKRSGGGAGAAGADGGGAKDAGGRGWGGAPTFSPSYQSTFNTAEMVTKTTTTRRTEVRMRFSPSDHSTAVSVTNEYYGEEENRCSLQDATLAPADHGPIWKVISEHCAHGSGRGGGYGDYSKDTGVCDYGAQAGSGDGNYIFNGDDYYNNAVGGFHDGYDGDGGDGADDWW